jgi:integrase
MEKRQTRSKRLPQSSDIDSRWYAEQRNRDGTVRRYWQPRGQTPVRLPDDLTWTAMITQLNRLRDAERGKTVVIGGTVAWVIQKYRETDRFAKLSASTTYVYRRWLAELEKLFGALPPSAITRKVAVDFIEVYKDKPSTQNHAAVVLYNVLAEAQYHGLIAGENPAAKLRLSSASRRDAIWSADDRAAWMEAAQQHPKYADALALYFTLLEYTAQRPGDVRAMQWTQYDGEQIELVQQKTGKLVHVPAHANLRAALDEARDDGVVRIGGPIVNHNGKPLTTTMSTKLFNEVRSTAKLDHLQARDLRRTACVRLAEAGCTPLEIAAISGHSIERTTQILETYVPRTKAMGRAAMDRWERNEIKKSDASDSEGV